MNSILVIQSRIRPEMIKAEQEGYERAVDGVANLIFKDALNPQDEWSSPKTILGEARAVILGGSGDLDFDGGREEGHEVRTLSKEIVKRLSPLISYIFENDIPTLGICYGHQIIGAFLGTRVFNDPRQNKVGTHPITLTNAGQADPLFSQLPSTFMGQYAHKDSLESVPTGATVMANGERCCASALRYKNTIYTSQFHPELTAQEILWKLVNSPGYLPEGIRAEDIVRDSKESSTLIPTFVRLFVK